MRGFQSNNANFGNRLMDNNSFGDVRLFPSLTTGSYGTVIPIDDIGSILGLFGRKYSGYFNDDVNWFNTATVTDTEQTTQIDKGSTGDSYSWMWLGYFYATTTETYTFYTTSDDASYLWIGDLAKTGYTTGNATVNNGGLHGAQERSGTSALTAGTYYPLRIQFGENFGGDNMKVEFSSPSVSRRTNGAGYYFGGQVSLFSGYP